MKCEICDGEFVILQTKRENKDNNFIKVTVYMKCNTCGCGRIDYHPSFPKNEAPSRS